MSEPSMINTGVLQRNPFPGSRPFTSAEDQLFFGRDNATSELIEILLQRKFVALVGASASGKTSLIQSGVIPALLSDMKEEWVPVYIRPGRRPLESLIKGVQQVFSKKISDSDVSSFLKSPGSLGDFLIEKGLGNYHYFLVVDQFEELFTWPVAVKKGKGGKNPESFQFINHLMKLVDDEIPQILLMLSIRSDFLDYCSNYRVLTEHLNRSKYLLPKMNRKDLTEAILEPFSVSGTSVEAGFEEYLLNDLEEVEPQLPLLQYALKRTWDHWKRKGKPDLPVSLEDYHASGGIRYGLNNDLEDLYQSLEFYQKEICERIFKTIAFKTGREEVFSRRTTLDNIARIARCNVDRVVEVVEIFYRAGHPFLGHQNSVPLSSDSEIELSHESLINIWDRLLQWVNEEDDSIRMYLNLSKASALYQQGKGTLLEISELQKALDWKKLNNPTPAWGIQFDPAFERAMVYLNTSEEEYIWSEKRKITLKRRKKILNRSIIIGSIVIAAAIALVIYISQNRQGEMDQKVQMSNREPLNERPSDQIPDIEIDQPAKETTPQSQEERPLRQNTEERPVQQGTDENARESTATQVDAETEVVNNQPEPTPTTDEQQAPATTVNRETEILLTIVRDVAYASLSISRDPDLQGLLAYQSYLLNKRYGGGVFDPDIYRGLYESKKKLISSIYYYYPNIRHSITDMAWLNRTGSVLAVSSDGSIKILSGNIADRASQMELAGTGLSNECVGVSPDEHIAAVGTNGGGMLFIELENRGTVINRNSEASDVVLFIENLGSSGSFLSAGTSNEILKWDYNSFNPSSFVKFMSRPLAMVSSKDGSMVMIGTASGSLYSVNVNNPSEQVEVNRFVSNQIWALDFSPGQRYLAAGMQDGSVKILSGDGKRTITSLFGPGARISDIAFSPNGRFLVAASNDGNVYMWNTMKWGDPPIVFTENKGFVLSLCFSENGSYFYSGSVDFPRLIGRPVDLDQMAEGFCSLLSRNLTTEEWNQYYGIDIPYEETCPR